MARRDAQRSRSREDDQRDGRQPAAQHAIGRASLAGAGIGQAGRFVMPMGRDMVQRVTQGAVLCQGEQEAERQDETQPRLAYGRAGRPAGTKVGGETGNHWRWARLRMARAVRWQAA